MLLEFLDLWQLGEDWIGWHTNDQQESVCNERLEIGETPMKTELTRPRRPHRD
jgi:hypothetical protein